MKCLGVQSLVLYRVHLRVAFDRLWRLTVMSLRPPRFGPSGVNLHFAMATSLVVGGSIPAPFGTDQPHQVGGKDA